MEEEEIDFRKGVSSSSFNKWLLKNNADPRLQLKYWKIVVHSVDQHLREMVKENPNVAYLVYQLERVMSTMSSIIKAMWIQERLPEQQ